MRYALSILAVVLSLSNISPAATVEPKSPIPPYSLIRVRLQPGERCWILSSTFEPVDAEIQPNLIVWTAPPGKYAVLSWTETSQGQQVVTISGTIPPPVPPGPDPPGPDPPIPPTPSEIKNQFGIGAVVFVEAMKVGKPAECLELAASAKLALDGLVSGKLTPAGAEAIIRGKRLTLSGNWSPWETAVEAAVAKAMATHGGGALIYRSYVTEIESGLRAAGTTRAIR